jgi:hypothetical protein
MRHSEKHHQRKSIARRPASATLIDKEDSYGPMTAIVTDDLTLVGSFGARILITH